MLRPQHKATSYMQLFQIPLEVYVILKWKKSETSFAFAFDSSRQFLSQNWIYSTNSSEFRTVIKTKVESVLHLV